LADGGELNIGPGINDIEVLAGLGALTDTYTNPLSPPVIQGIEWPQINTPITAAPPVAGSAVWFSIADTGIPSTSIGNVPINLGELKQYAQPPNPSLSRRELFLGLAVHNGDEWKEISNPKVINQAAETLREVATVVLPFSSIVSGGSTRETGTFQVEQDEGVVWENNRNWHVDKSDPNRETLPAQSSVTFKYVTRDFSFVGAATDTFDPDTYDVGGTPTPVPPGSGNTATIQRLYIDPANNYWCLYGQETYPNFFTAEANLGADLAKTELPFILQNSILLGSAVMEQGKNNWDPDEAVWIPAGGSAGAGGGGGTPITDHNNLNGIGPDDHHARMVAVGDYVQGVTYFKGDELYDGSNLSEALIDGVTSQPFVSPIGEDRNVYQGTMADAAPQSAKLINFGIRLPAGLDPAYIKGYRVWTTIGNTYNVYAIVDPLGTPRSRTLLSFTATSSGWQDFTLPNPSTYNGEEVLDVICQVAEPDPTPTQFIWEYDYQTPQNIGVPASGQISHGRGSPDVMRISHIDNLGADHTAIITGLDVGDIIQAGLIRWSIQSNTNNGTDSTFVVAPATTATAGVQDITFETKLATPITIGEDPLYWDNEPAPRSLIRGLLGVDTPLTGVVPDGNAYGMDLLVQDAFIPDQTEWRLKIVGGISASGGSGGGFTPTTFTGAGTTGYVPDPVTEDGKYLLDDGTWTNTIDGGTF